jgi:hypothetical protein
MGLAGILVALLNGQLSGRERLTPLAISLLPLTVAGVNVVWALRTLRAWAVPKLHSSDLPEALAPGDGTCRQIIPPVLFAFWRVSWRFGLLLAGPAT